MTTCYDSQLVDHHIGEIDLADAEDEASERDWGQARDNFRAMVKTGNYEAVGEFMYLFSEGDLDKLFVPLFKAMQSVLKKQDTNGCVESLCETLACAWADEQVPE